MSPPTLLKYPPKFQVLKCQNSKFSKFRNPKIEFTHQSSTIRCFYTIQVQASRKQVRAPGPEIASSCQAPEISSTKIPKFQNFEILKSQN